MMRGNKVVLREKRLEDAKDDYAWRTDAELARLDGTLPLHTSFSEYLLSYAEELHHSGLFRRHFAIESEEGKHIGNCMYYNIDDHRKEAEIGIMIGDRSYWDKGYGTDVVTTLVNHIFQETKVERIYLHTLEWNIRAQKCFLKCGFVPCGRTIRNGNHYILMEIKRRAPNPFTPPQD